MTRTHSLFDGYSIEVMSCDMADITATGARLPPPAAVLIPSLSSEGLTEQVTAARKARQLGFSPVCHIAARRLDSLERLDAHLAALRRDAQAEAAFVIAGDLVAPVGPFDETLDLLRTGLFVEHGFRTIGLAGHPEGHPAVSQAVLWQALEAKVAEVAAADQRSEIVTQFAFDAAKVLAWITELRQRGIESRLRIGVPGPANVTTLLKYAKLCGVGASASAVGKYGFSLGRLLGSAGPDRFVSELEAGLDRLGEDKTTLHLFPFGGFAAAAKWLNARVPPLAA